MEKNISPEERLLRLIRADRPKKARATEQKPAKSPDVSGSGNIIQKAALAISFNLINRILVRALLILGIYFLIDFLIINPDKIEEKVLALGELRGADLVKMPVPLLKPVAYYAQGVKARNLFAAVSRKVRKDLPSSIFMEMVSNLRLQGIISGIKPQAIIEGIKTGQVYFVSPGEYIGEIELKEILPGKVKLNYYGQEAELRI